VQIETLLSALRDGAVDLHGAARQIADLVSGSAARRDAVKQRLEQALTQNQLALPQYASLLAALDGLTMLREAIPRRAADDTDATTLREAPPPAPLRSGVSAQTGIAEPATEIGPGSWVRGRYVLTQMIGSGGMGQVWKAKDSYLERTDDPFPFVAIKMLNANLEHDPDGYVALQRETKKAQELAHPNVVTVHLFDTDSPGSGRAFMSMELLEGECLDARIRRHPNGDARGFPIESASCFGKSASILSSSIARRSRNTSRTRAAYPKSSISA